MLRVLVLLAAVGGTAWVAVVATGAVTSLRGLVYWMLASLLVSLVAAASVDPPDTPRPWRWAAWGLALAHVLLAALVMVWLAVEGMPV